MKNLMHGDKFTGRSGPSGVQEHENMKGCMYECENRHPAPPSVLHSAASLNVWMAHTWQHVRSRLIRCFCVIAFAEILPLADVKEMQMASRRRFQPGSEPVKSAIARLWSGFEMHLSHRRGRFVLSLSDV